MKTSVTRRKNEVTHLADEEELLREEEEEEGKAEEDNVSVRRSIRDARRGRRRITMPR